jgi:hypothetical protein
MLNLINSVCETLVLTIYPGSMTYKMSRGNANGCTAPAKTPPEEN